jgi:hypothetical protein
MPRQSVEARAAAAWRAGKVMPEPPMYLSDEAKSLWVGIVSSKPADWFDAGSFPLLAMFCGMAVRAKELAIQRSAVPVLDREAARLERRWHKAVAVMLNLATKCRLTPQNRIDRRSGMLTEGGWGGDPLLRGRSG